MCATELCICVQLNGVYVCNWVVYARTFGKFLEVSRKDGKEIEGPVLESESTYGPSAMTELGMHEIVPRKTDW